MHISPKLPYLNVQCIICIAAKSVHNFVICAFCLQHTIPNQLSSFQELRMPAFTTVQLYKLMHHISKAVSLPTLSQNQNQTSDPSLLQDYFFNITFFISFNI